MRFTINTIDKTDDVATYNMTFENGEDVRNFTTSIGLPEILDDSKVLQIIAACCQAEFTGDGGIFVGKNKFSGKVVTIGEWVDV